MEQNRINGTDMTQYIDKNILKDIKKSNIKNGDGEGSVVVGESYADGKGSVAFGDECYTDGLGSFVHGDQCETDGDYSHAEGELTNAIGKSSHAEGYNTVANGDYSHAEGASTIANNNYECALGIFNRSFDGISDGTIFFSWMWKNRKAKWSNGND